MRLRTILRLSILLCLVLGLTQSAQAQLYDHVILDSESGIAGLQVNAISQDASGYLWIATNAGVSRFDGNNFKNYTIRNGLSENHAASIFCDAQNRVWVGHQTAGISVIYKDSIQHISENDGLANNEVHDFFQDGSGTLWVSTFGGLSKYQNGTWSSLTTADGLASNNVQVARADDQGNIWVGTYGAGINILQDKSIRHLHMGNGLVNNYVTSLFADGNRMLIGTLGGLSQWSAIGSAPDRKPRTYHPTRSTTWYWAQIRSFGWPPLTVP